MTDEPKFTPEPTLQTALDLIAEQAMVIIALEERVLMLEGKTGLALLDPHQEGELGMQLAHVEEQRERFNRDNGPFDKEEK